MFYEFTNILSIMPVLFSKITSFSQLFIKRPPYSQFLLLTKQIFAEFLRKNPQKFLSYSKGSNKNYTNLQLVFTLQLNGS